VALFHFTASNPQQMETDLQLVQRLAKLTPEAVAPGGALHEEGLTNILLRKVEAPQSPSLSYATLGIAVEHCKRHCLQI
jgi:hypothetical protein